LFPVQKRSRWYEQAGAVLDGFCPGAARNARKLLGYLKVLVVSSRKQGILFGYPSPLLFVRAILCCWVRTEDGSLGTCCTVEEKTWYIHKYSYYPIAYPPITYYWTVPLILDHSYLVGKSTSSNIADTKVSGF
jgi:hypothetical protein